MWQPKTMCLDGDHAGCQSVFCACPCHTSEEPRIDGLDSLRITRRLIVLDDPVSEPLTAEQLEKMKFWWGEVHDKLLRDALGVPAVTSATYSTTAGSLTVEALMRAIDALKPARLYVTKSWLDDEHILRMAPTMFEKRDSYVCNPNQFEELLRRMPNLRDLMEVRESEF